MPRDLLASRELAWRLAVHDISAQYRQTFLGALWAFILPLWPTPSSGSSSAGRASSSGQPVHLIGVEFSREQRNLVGFEAEHFWRVG
jgi:hypothetical protein